MAETIENTGQPTSQEAVKDAEAPTPQKSRTELIRELLPQLIPELIREFRIVDRDELECAILEADKTYGFNSRWHSRLSPAAQRDDEDIENLRKFFHSWKGEKLWEAIERLRRIEKIYLAATMAGQNFRAEHSDSEQVFSGPEYEKAEQRLSSATENLALFAREFESIKEALEKVPCRGPGQGQHGSRIGSDADREAFCDAVNVLANYWDSLPGRKFKQNHLPVAWDSRDTHRPSRKAPESAVFCYRVVECIWPELVVHLRAVLRKVGENRTRAPRSSKLRQVKSKREKA